MRAYKFYSKRWGIDALYRRRLKITTINDLNDPFEFRAVNTRVKSDRLNLEQWRSDMFSDKGVICFCRSWTNPIVWSHYGDSHKGLALGFEIDDATVYEVSYVKERIEMPPEIRSGNRKSADINLGRRLVSTKFDHWAYEQEVRIFCGLNDANFENGLYFEQFGDKLVLKEGIFGADYESGGNVRLSAALEDMGVEFTSARLAFKSFTVARQKRNDQWKSL